MNIYKCGVLFILAPNAVLARRIANKVGLAGVPLARYETPKAAQKRPAC